MIDAIAKIDTVKLVTASGRPIRTATRVWFTDGTKMTFGEKLSKKAAISNALREKFGA